MVRRLLEAQGQAAWADVLSCLHPQVEWIGQRAATEGIYLGHEGIERFVADTEATFETFEPHFDLRDLGDAVLAWGSIAVRGRGSGVGLDVPVGGIFEFRDGLIGKWQDFGSKEAALEAVGLAD